MTFSSTCSGPNSAGRQIVHHVEEDLFEDGAQAAGAPSRRLRRAGRPHAGPRRGCRLDALQAEHLTNCLTWRSLGRREGSGRACPHRIVERRVIGSRPINSGGIMPEPSNPGASRGGGRLRSSCPAGDGRRRRSQAAFADADSITLVSPSKAPPQMKRILWC